jgi:hypothetical protein
MQAKVIKLKRQRRAWARPSSVKSGIQPNREVIRQYQDTAKGLGKIIAQVRFPNVAPGRKEIMDKINTIGDPLRGIALDIKDPLFVKIVDNSRQRCRVYFNSGMSCFILQWAHWEKGFVKISMTYASSTRAIDAWNTDRVVWKKEFTIRKR